MVHEKKAVTKATKPEDNMIDTDTFRRAFETVLRRYSQTFKSLAEYDRGR